MTSIAFHVHPVFWALMLLALLAGQFVQVVTLFVLVLLHEAGHVIAALLYGWRIRKIELLPFGGVAEMDEWGGTRAREEIVVTLAGPAVNAALILLGWLLEYMGIWSSVWTAFFVYSNMVIAVFNMLPIWPLDGGRLLQIVYSFFISYRRSMDVTLYGSVLGALVLLYWSSTQPVPHLNGMAVSFYLLFHNVMDYRQRPYLFLRFLLSRQARLSRYAEGLAILPVRIEPDMRVHEAVRTLRRNRYHHFWLTGERSGFVPEEKLLASFFDARLRNCTVRELLR
ncbi:stage IV sporulation protein FB [Aneurinibacillus soli]|uniref:Stage IV sporulation protein FB n=1 Tax=Aneurinibacillus soli TaxID=1500254 RepID=A0A0U4WDY2_9BACL|nr:M50 family metallopeptidase [Aneurinibacillus soli]PYE62440.1 stage IV sporulation protein FB [Aneurinibacillus soli]BAU27003.1 Stage IV sporulation protein FB [Aneurinibacillus soli]